MAADSTIAYTPSLDISWRVTEHGAAGTVTNLGTQPMEDVAIISQSGGLMIGSLEPGASRGFELQQRNLSGSPASEQVYGFAGVDVGSEAGRRTAARRAMIDAIVGYGGVRDALLGGNGGFDRGPFLIGWRVGDPPVGIEVEGQDVQHHSQAVEVLSTRPSFAGGSVTIQPSQTAIEVTQLLGQASQPEPGFVVLGNGEVVFRVTLPLEAAGLQPSEVRLIAANDAGSILFNQGNLGSLLPAGYRLSVLDATSGEWTDVGDLSRQSRFVLPDPTAVLDSHGRILIRISASGLSEEIGQIPVFAGARVSGVIAR